MDNEGRPLDRFELEPSKNVKVAGARHFEGGSLFYVEVYSGIVYYSQNGSWIFGSLSWYVVGIYRPYYLHKRHDTYLHKIPLLPMVRYDTTFLTT